MFSKGVIQSRFLCHLKNPKALMEIVIWYRPRREYHRLSILNAAFVMSLSFEQNTSLLLWFINWGSIKFPRTSPHRWDQLGRLPHVLQTFPLPLPRYQASDMDSSLKGDEANPPQNTADLTAFVRGICFFLMDAICGYKLKTFSHGAKLSLELLRMKWNSK